MVVRREQKGDTVLKENLIRIESTPPEKENVDLFSVPTRIGHSAKVTLGSEETVPGNYSNPSVITQHYFLIRVQTPQNI